MSRVLIVDDDPTFRSYLAELVKLDGHEALEADDGSRAFQMLSASANAFDLLLCDFNMKQMGGYELIRKVRAMDHVRQIPVIMITGTTRRIQPLVEMEGVQYLSKLSLNSDILNAIRKFIKPAAQGGAGSGNPTLPIAPSFHPESGPESASTLRSGQDDASEAAADEPRLDAEEFNILVESADVPEENEPISEDHSSPNSPMRKLVNAILAEAISREASDIHIEPREKEIAIRFRIDGALQSAYRLPARFKGSMPARIKVMAQLDIAERRLPQDGRFSIVVGGDKRVQFRVSTLPSQYGEKVVLRLLRRGKLESDLRQIFTRPHDLHCVEQALKSSSGLILITGPTGSGKTTTLYTMLQNLNEPDVNIITVEDPIEYELPGITQVAVRSDIDFTFAKVLRSCLRQDPDVILVGEIRDQETAEIALKASMTGHLVLSTLHTNSATLAPNRLADMGIKPFLVIGALRLVVAQRLLRLLCPHCKVKTDPRSEEISHLSEDDWTSLKEVYGPKGCEQCKGIGYKGRIPVMEVMPVKSHEMRQMILECVNPDNIARRAVSEGMTTLAQSAINLVKSGQTSLSEALSVYLMD
ncbi:MAG: Flp pilus assembly complex ATPase component TadA [Elusimicrobia bacterium]|nr:Flp pilus assembly complex ATPase component TadA [Elusimicrobiota bacterium]